MEVHCTTKPSSDMPAFRVDDALDGVSGWEAFKNDGAFTMPPQDAERLYKAMIARRRFIARGHELPPFTIVIHDDALGSIPLKWLRALCGNHPIFSTGMRLVGDPDVLYGPEQGYDQWQFFARLIADMPY